MAIVRRRGTAIVETPNGILVVAGRSKKFMLPGGGAEKRESRKRAAMIIDGNKSKEEIIKEIERYLNYV